MPKYGGETKFQPKEFPRSGWKAEGIEEEEKSVKTMASFASVRHHGWRTQAALTKSLLAMSNFKCKSFLCLVQI